MEGWAGLLVALEASRVAVICSSGLTCGGLGGPLVDLGALVVALCRAVCHEGLEETGGRMERMRSGFDIEL